MRIALLLLLLLAGCASTGEERDPRDPWEGMNRGIYKFNETFDEYLGKPVARGYRREGLQRVDLFWSGSSAHGFDVYRDGERIATVSAGPYHDRLERSGSGSYRYHVAETATAACSGLRPVAKAFGDDSGIT